MRAEIVAVGTELLIGQIANTNARWMSERLAELGIDVLHHQVVGDNERRIVEAKHAVEVTIVADGGDPDTFQLRAGEGRSFDGDNSITIRLSEGNTAHVIVSGVDYGFPGKNGEPWEDTYSYDEPSTPGG